MAPLCLRPLVILVLLALLGWSPQPAFAEPDQKDWPQLRGLARDGVATDAGLAATWPEAGPPVLWKRPLGQGFSGISIVDGKLFTMFATEPPAEEGKEETPEEEAARAAKGEEVLAAFDRATGKELWRAVLGPTYVDQFGNGPRATPTVEGGTVYAFGGQGNLLAAAADTGKVLWRLDTAEAFGAKTPQFGFSTSPIVIGGSLIIEAGGGEGKALAGLDKASGEILWTALDGDPGYRSPVLMTVAGQAQIVTKVGTDLLAIDASGNTLWTHPWEASMVAVPVLAAPDLIFFSSPSDVGAIMLRISEKEGKLAAEEVWASRVMKNHFNSSVAVGGYIYGFDNATLKCVDALTGKQAWAKRGLGKGSLIAADGYLFVVSDQGLLVRLEATPEGYREAGQIQAMEGKSWTSPTIAGGHIYLRNLREMVALDLAG